MQLKGDSQLPAVEQTSFHIFIRKLPFPSTLNTRRPQTRTRRSGARHSSTLQSLHDASQSFRVSGIGYRWSPQSCCRIPRFLASSLAEMGNATQKNHVIRLPRPEVSADLFAFKRRPISRGDVMPHKTGRSLQLPLLRITRITPRSKLLFCYIIHTRTY
jgi:hypothetical protein